MDDILGDKELVTKPEDTATMIRIPVDSGDHDGHRIRTIEISAKEGIQALYCGTDKVIMTYLFDKSKGWDMAKAKKWVKDHEGKTINEITEHKVSQDEIIDEIDYTSTLIKENGMNEDVKKAALEFSQKVIVQLKDELPKDITEIMFHISRKAMGYECFNHWDIDKNGERIKGLDLRKPGNDIPVEIKAELPTVVLNVTVETKEALTNQDILESIKRLSK